MVRSTHRIPRAGRAHGHRPQRRHAAGTRAARLTIPAQPRPETLSAGRPMQRPMRLLLSPLSRAGASSTLLLIAILLLVGQSSLISHFLSNIGMLDFTKAVTTAAVHSSNQASYPLFNVLSRSDATSLSWFQQALKIDDQNISASHGM